MARVPIEAFRSVAVSVQSMSLSDDAHTLSVDGIDLDSGRAVTVSVTDQQKRTVGRRMDAAADQLVLVLTLERVS